MRTDALERTIRRAGASTPAGGERGPGGERCELCAAELAADHRHLLDRERSQLACVCPACALLFPGDGRHYRLVPDRRRRLEPLPTASLGVPVGLAFFVRKDDGGVLAHYPSPAGATRFEVDRSAWAQLAVSHPVLGELEPEVEAILVNAVAGSGAGRSETHLVSIADCFRLVAVIRRSWEGLSGGPNLNGEIERFFHELRGSQPAPDSSATQSSQPAQSSQATPDSSATQSS